MGGFYFESYSEKIIAGKRSSWRNDAIFRGGGAVHAASVDVQPSEPSDNTVEVNEKDYSINGEKTELGENDTYYYVYGGCNFDSENVTGNILTINGGIFNNWDVYGGYTGGNATNNTLNIYGGIFGRDVFGGSSFYDGDVTGNILNIVDGTFNAAIFGGLSNSGKANNNTINIYGGTFNSQIDGGHASSSASYNTINIYGGYFAEHVTINGGLSTITKGNTITITGGTINSWVYGGYSNSEESGENTINISGGTLNAPIYGGGSNNVINISGSPNLNASISGGTVNSGNTLNVYTKNLSARNIYSFDNMNFYLDSNISSGDTMLTLTGGQTDVSSTDIQAVMQSGSPLTDGDIVTLLKNENGITEAQSYTGTLAEGVSLSYPMTVKRANDGNRIILGIGNFVEDSGTDSSGTDTSGTDTSGTDSSGSDSSGTDTSGTDSSGTDTSDTDSSGSDSSGSDTSGTDTSGTDTSGTDTSGTDSSGSDSSAVDDSNNTVNLYSTNSGTIYGGYTDSGNASNNTVNLYSGTFENIYGGYAPSGETSNNTLNVYNKNISAQNLSNFSAMNFYIPTDAANGDTMLMLTDSTTTDLSGVAIRAGVVSGNSNLAAGDTINLMTNSNGFVTDSATTYGTLSEGVSLDYGLTVSNSGSNILATIDSIPNTGLPLNGQTQSIPLSSGLTSINTVNTVLDNNNLPAIGLDFDFENDEDDAAAQEIVDIQIVEPKGWEIFASMGGGALKTKAGDGAFVDMKLSSFDVGFARTLPNGGAGKFVFAPIIDYAHGNYDSYLADGTHGTGSTRYIAGGGVFRNMWDSGFYVEGSFRAGKVKSDFASNDMDKTFGQRVSYDTKATAMAGHFKLGKNLRLNRNNLLDVYATYYHAHQGGMNADLNPYGDKYRISSANSGRFRIGYRMTTRTSKISRIYTGLAYQYEHSSGITANYLAKNLSTASAGDNGSSGMLEIGWIIKPLKNNPWTVDINATGWVGHQRGVTATAKIQKAF